MISSLQFLNSQYINERIYTEQIEEISYYYHELAKEGAMSLEQFVPLAHVILQMIYALAYPNQVRIIIIVHTIIMH